MVSAEAQAETAQEITDTSTKEEQVAAEDESAVVSSSDVKAEEKNED